MNNPLNCTIICTLFIRGSRSRANRFAEKFVEDTPTIRLRVTSSVSTYDVRRRFEAAVVLGAPF